jgi:hypothetical protein
MGVAVEDHLRTAFEERRGQPVGAEERPDPARLALERRQRRGVVEQRDSGVAAVDRGQARSERVDLGGRLGVHVPQERLAEVGELRVWEAADEALRPGDAEPRAVDVLDREAAADHPHACVGQRGRELLDLRAVPVMVAEHREDRGRQPSDELREHPGLVELAVGRQVAREEDRVHVAVDMGEGALERVAVRLAVRRRPRRRESASACD